MPWPAIALDEWKPVSRPVAMIAIAFYLLFLLYAANNRSGFLFLDYANLAIHEAGHPLFGISAVAERTASATRSWSWAAHSSNS